MLLLKALFRQMLDILEILKLDEEEVQIQCLHLVLLEKVEQPHIDVIYLGIQDGFMQQQNRGEMIYFVLGLLF
jgi:hypothetical protein